MNNVVLQLSTEYESSNGSSNHLFRLTGEMTPPNSSGSEETLAYGKQVSPDSTELRALSQPIYSSSVENYPNYVYPVGHIPTYIYHVELGIDQQHPDFDGREREWLFTEKAKDSGADTMTEAATGQGHSTCTASKAVGNLYGASKSATLVVVKMPGLDEASVYEVLDTVIDDIDDKGRWDCSVVSISWNTIDTATPEFVRSPLAARIRHQVATLMASNVRVVCAAGNNALKHTPAGKLRTYIDTYPPLSLDPSSIHQSTSLFHVVGNSDINGWRSQASQLTTAERSQLYAPGVSVRCASNTSPTGYTTLTGTSFCESPLTNLWFLTHSPISSRTSCSWCHRRSAFNGTFIFQPSVLVEKTRRRKRCLEFSY